MDRSEDLQDVHRIARSAVDHLCALPHLSGTAGHGAGVHRDSTAEAEAGEVVVGEEVTGIGTTIGGTTDRGATRRVGVEVLRGDAGARAMAADRRRQGGWTIVQGEEAVVVGGEARATRVMGAGVGVGADAEGKSDIVTKVQSWHGHGARSTSRCGQETSP